VRWYLDQRGWCHTGSRLGLLEPAGLSSP
jgi:hypothetical protein